MNIIDLTHKISADMPVFPGTSKPFLKQEYTILENGYAETLLQIVSHTGTHIDAPAHMITNGKSLDSFPVSTFMGKALKIDFRNFSKNEIMIEDLIQFQHKLNTTEILILQFGWSEFWGAEKYFENFPALNKEAAEWLTKFQIRGIGIDAISIDLIDSTTFPVHHVLLRENWFAVENLTNLNLIPSDEFTFGAFPLHYENADGAPVRAVAILE